MVLTKTSTPANGAAIKAIREAQGWKLGQFAIACGTTHPHMSNIEAGRKHPSASLLRSIADTLQVPLIAVKGNVFDTGDAA